LCFQTFAQTQRTWSEIYRKLLELVEKQRHTKIRFCLPTNLLPFPARSESTSNSALKKKQSRVAVTSKRIPRNGFGKSETTYYMTDVHFILAVVPDDDHGNRIPDGDDKVHEYVIL
jgi:hypothetical protein